MCGIVAGVSTRNIVPILVEGLKRLEYRGYDSCGVAVHQDGMLRRTRSTARVAELQEHVNADHVQSGTGIAHTRWATHGAPAVHNAHPHFSGPLEPETAASSADASRGARIALVHNGIIENHDELRDELKAKGFRFESQTDTEVIAHLVNHLYDGDLFDAVQRAVLMHGDAAGVVAAVLEPLQALDEDGNDVAGTDAGDDATHGKTPGTVAGCAMDGIVGAVGG